MPRQVTIANLRSRARRAADVEGETSRFPDAEVDDYLLDGLAQLQSELIITDGQGFQEGITSFNTVKGTENYSLPLAWLNIVKLWTVIDGVERVLRNYQEEDTNGMHDPLTLGWEAVPMWRIVLNDSISLRPIPDSVRTINVKYINVTPGSIGATVDGVNGLEGFMIYWAAELMATKNRDDVLIGLLQPRRSELLQRLRAIQKARNRASPPTVIDMRGSSIANARAYRWGRRYP